MINTLNILNRYQADTICCVVDLYFRLLRNTLRCFKLAYKNESYYFRLKSDSQWANFANAPSKNTLKR